MTAALTARAAARPVESSSASVSLMHLSRREWRAHPWRYAVIVLALALGVALAWSVHLINASALAEFAAAVRTTQGAPDAVLRGSRAAAADLSGAVGAVGGVPDAWLDRIAADPAVSLAIGVIEIDTYARASAQARVAVRVMGIDALEAAALAPALVPRLAAGADPLSLMDPSRVYVNVAAREALKLRDGETLELQAGTRWQRFVISGDVPVAGGPLMVIDIAAAQSAFALGGTLTRIDLRLAPGATVERIAVPLPPGTSWSRADDGEQRVSSLSRAYRVNLTVLALVALLVGAFMAYSVVALAVAQRTPSLALLGVLGLTAGERRWLVLRECAWLGVMGSALGLLLGAGMAAWALKTMGGDLGGGYFPGVAPTLSVDPFAALMMALLGLAAALIGGYVPARAAEQIRPAQALKGLGDEGAARGPWSSWLGWALLVLGAALALLPPIMGVPVAAYASVAALLFGGVALVPWVVRHLLALAPRPKTALGLLALRRAAFHRQTAMAVVAGVVASLALSVALTVMVQSFRSSVAGWLDQVLPADLYLRTAANSALAEQAWLDDGFEALAVATPGVRRVEAARLRALNFASERPPVTLIARRLSSLGDPAERLPLIDAPLKPAPGEDGVYVSEAMATLYGARTGSMLMLPLPLALGDGRTAIELRVLGVWRDFARQFGAVAIDLELYRKLTGDGRVNEMSIWLEPGADVLAVQAALRKQAAEGAVVEFITTAELRRVSLRIFDRSFAVTTYLQAVAIGIGLVGVAAGLSAQVLARRKEFGLLSHLGLLRREVLWLVCVETAAWLAAGVARRRAAGAGHRRDPGARGQSAELSLDDGDEAALALACRAGRRGDGQRCAHGVAQRTCCRFTRHGACGAGGLVSSIHTLVRGGMLQRRAWLRGLPPLLGVALGTTCTPGTTWSATPENDEVKRGRKLIFPRDHGAHLAQRIEWWYLTGWCTTQSAVQSTEPEFGFQVTFFRVRTGLAESLASRFAPRHLLMAHAALTDLKAGRHLHADRLARWSGEGVEARRGASLDDAQVRLGAWHIQRSEVAGAPSLWTSTIDAGEWALDLRLQATQPLLLQGEEGFSRKGPEASQASLYVTEPQLDAAVRLRLGGRGVEARGRAWLDHEWSDTLMPTDAVGWDWIGMNLDDGSALTAFRLRRADGATVWAGGSFRARGASARSFTPGEVVFEPGRIWRSSSTNGYYPVEWRITCPAGRFEVKSLLDAQELDARASTGTVYWEGLSSLHDAQGQRVGYGYLEMTGYVGRLRF